MRASSTLTRSAGITALLITLYGCASGGDPQAQLPTVTPTVKVVDYIDQIIEVTNNPLGGWLEQMIIERMKPSVGDGYEARQGIWCSLHPEMETRDQFSQMMGNICSSKNGILVDEKYCVAGSTPNGEENVIFAYQFTYSPACSNNSRSPGNMSIKLYEKTSAELSAHYKTILQQQFRYETLVERTKNERLKQQNRQAYLDAIRVEKERKLAHEKSVNERKQRELAERKKQNRIMMASATLGQKVCRWGELDYDSFDYREMRKVEGALIGEYLRQNNDPQNPRVEIRIQGWGMNEPWTGSKLSDVNGHFRMGIISSKSGGVYWDHIENWRPCSL